MQLRGRQLRYHDSHVVPDAEVDFPWFEANQTDAEGGACDNGFCVVTDAKVVQDGVTTNLVGIAVAKPGFFAYQVRPGEWTTNDSAQPVLVPAEGDNDPLMVFGGDGYSFDTPSGKVHTFQLTQDISQPAPSVLLPRQNPLPRHPLRRQQETDIFRPWCCWRRIAPAWTATGSKPRRLAADQLLRWQ